MKTRQLILTSLFAALTGIGALISFPLPFSPVPVSLQVFFTLLAGVILGSRFGALSQLIYICLGAIGLPIFAGGGGFQHLVGPTAGYLWGFIAAAFVTGLVARKMSSLTGDLVAMILGLATIYLPGMLGLHWIAGLPMNKAFLGGVVPFLPGDLAKIIAAAIISRQLARRIPQYYQQMGK